MRDETEVRKMAEDGKSAEQKANEGPETAVVPKEEKKGSGKIKNG